MNESCEGESSIPASSFARAAAALALESTVVQSEVPDSDSSISDSSDDMGDSDESSCDGDHVDEAGTDEVGETSNVGYVASELSAGMNPDSAIHSSYERDATVQQSQPLDATELSPNTNLDSKINGLDDGADILQTPKESDSPAPAVCELTPEASNRTAANGLFESDSTTENHHINQEQTKAKNMGESQMLMADYQEEHVYNLCPTYSHSPASFADSCSFMTSPAPLSKKVENTKTTTAADQSSLLSRGLSLFGKTATSARVSSNGQPIDDASSVISDLSHDVRSVKSSTTLRTNTSAGQRIRDDARLQKHLEESGLVLVKRLIEFLSACPPAPDEDDDGAANLDTAKRKKPRGLTLPASSIGWISFQIMKYNDDTNSISCNSNPDEDVFDCYQVPKQQLECLQTLIRRVTSLRVTNDKWPPPMAPALSEAADTVKRKAFSSIPETGVVSSRILSKFTDQSSVAGMNSLGDDSVSTGTAKDSIATPFQRYFHELQYNPNIDMRMFPYASKIVVDGIPPNWISHLDTLHYLDMFQMEKGCILDINRLFFPSDDTEAVHSTTEEDGSPLHVYKSVTKLRLSNCAMSEAAGLRGRRRFKATDQSTRIKRIPTLSRFPNLESLNLSHNELFRTKTALAGLSSLPLLSSINLSYNRLSSLSTIFMHVGNVKELILSGNEIASTQGLDRLFSLEHLSLDNNKIRHLSDISSLAKLPILMNLDIKGNPFENADPVSCRIEVFNLFREVRCKSLPKTATYRDMQQLLPILDSVLATKDELVAIKNLTFRQAVSMVETDSSVATEITEMKVDILDLNRFRRQVTKQSAPRTVHCRSNNLPSDNQCVLRIAFEESNLQPHTINAQYRIEDIITSIRPDMELSDNSISQTMSSYHRSRTQSSFSLGKLDREGSELAEADFPFALPPSILDQATDGTWNPIPLSETLPDYVPPEQDSTQLTGNGEQMDFNEMIPSSFSCDADVPAADAPNNNYHDIYKETGQGECTNEDDKLKSKSMFGGIWEQTYRDNVTNTTELDTDNSTKDTSPKAIDYDVEERNALYDGPSDYSSIFVSSDLDLYFDSFVFPRASDEDSQDDSLEKDQTMPPRIQLFRFDRNAFHEGHVNQADLSERFIGVWREDVLACGSFARSRVHPIKMPKRGFHGENITESGKDKYVSGSRKIVVCLSDSALYLIADDDVTPKQKKVEGAKRAFPSRIPNSATFGDAYWPHALARHSLDCLVGITIGFQFQRLILRFSVSNANGVTLEYSYVLLTSNKLQTISLLQKLQSQASDNRLNSIEKQPVQIENDDKAFLDALGARTDEVVLHYQILRQFWKRGDREAARRSFVLTDSKIYLLDESYDGDGSNSDEDARRLGDISLAVIDSATLNRVTEVRAANEDPCMITLVIQPLNKLKRAHRWRLVCSDGEGAERLIDDVRKAIRSQM